MDKSDFLENAVLNHVLRNTPYVPSATIEVYLFTTLPVEGSGGGVEVSGGNYARQSVTFAAPSEGIVVNSDSVTFPQASASWGMVVGLGLFEDESAGSHILYFGPLTTPKSVEAGDQLTFAAGALTLREA